MYNFTREVGAFAPTSLVTAYFYAEISKNRRDVHVILYSSILCATCKHKTLQCVFIIVIKGIFNLPTHDLTKFKHHLVISSNHRLKLDLLTNISILTPVD